MYVRVLNSLVFMEDYLISYHVCLCNSQYTVVAVFLASVISNSLTTFIICYLDSIFKLVLDFSLLIFGLFILRLLLCFIQYYYKASMRV